MPRWSYRLLGGLRVLAEGRAPDLGTRKQRAVLAALLLAEGRVVSVDRLIDVVWPEGPPDRAEASLQSYVSVLRRGLEPDRAPRTPPTLLVTRGPGYALLAERREVDLWRLVDLVEAGRAAAAEGRPAEALTSLREALALHGPLLPEFAGEEFTRAAQTVLDGAHLAARELTAAARLALGEHRVLVGELSAAVAEHPLHEEFWALLAIALYRCGRQSEALRAVADCKRVLADEIGVDPGPRLRRLESDLLAQAPELGPPVAVVTPTTVPTLASRRAQLDLLDRVVQDVTNGGRAVAIVSAEPGAGKTWLLEEAADRAGLRGVAVAWGRCAEDAGAPALWPWIQVVGDLAPRTADGHADPLADRELDAGSRFRQVSAVSALLRDVAATRPVLVVLDDLQWADVESLELFDHLATRLPARTALVAALRDRAPAPSADLSRTLAAAGRARGYRRIGLEPLGEDDVAALVEQETGTRPDGAVLRSLTERTGGNPYFVCELARSLGGTTSLAGVPAGVRDVVRGRLEALPEETTDLLRLAALIGRDVDLGLLADAAGVSAAQCLDRLDPAAALGVVGPHPRDPFSYRFSHDLVREAIAEATPPARTTRRHLQVAEALERRAGTDDLQIERLAHHLWSAGPLAETRRTLDAALRAASLALGRQAHARAERWLSLAADLARSCGAVEQEVEAVGLLATVVGLRRGYVHAPLPMIERAEHLARQLGRRRTAGSLLYARWAAHSQAVRLDLGGPLAVALRDLGEAEPDDPMLRRLGAYAWGVDRWDRGLIAESVVALRRCAELPDAAPQEGAVPREEAAAWSDLRLFAPAFLAYVTALAGDVAEARRILDGLARTAGLNPYDQVVRFHFATNVASMSGDARWTAQLAARGIAADPEQEHAFSGVYLGIAQRWSQAHLTSGDARREAVERLAELLEGLRASGARSGEHSVWTLLAEARLLAGQLDGARAALDTAVTAVRETGQCFAEPLIGLTSARWLAATGADGAQVRSVVEDARGLARERGALLFDRRADDLISELRL